MTKRIKKKESRYRQRGGQSPTLIGTFLAYGDGAAGMVSACWDFCKGGILTQDTWNSLALSVVNTPSHCYNGDETTKTHIRTIMNSSPNTYIVDITDLNNVLKFKFYCIGRKDTDQVYLSTHWGRVGETYQFKFDSSNIIYQSGTPGWATKYNVYYSIAPPTIQAAIAPSSGTLGTATYPGTSVQAAIAPSSGTLGTATYPGYSDKAIKAPSVGGYRRRKNKKTRRRPYKIENKTRKN
jgi:hypothetical protein